MSNTASVHSQSYSHQYQHFLVKPVAGRIGAEISGIQLSAELPEAVVKDIRAALAQYKVVFFKGQTHLDDQSQEGFAQLLGKPIAHPTVPSKDGTAYVLELDSQHGDRANSWHTDVTFDVNPPAFSVLRGVVIPAAGGDTVWANAAAAYNDLPPELKTLAESLRAIHSNDYDYAAARPKASVEATEKHRKVFTSTIYETNHPVVRVHPENGERSLVLGHFFKRFVGLSTLDSLQLYHVLQHHVTRLENTVRWRWTVGDIAIWDNRATQHYAVDDYENAHRVVRRVTIAGPIPVGVDGQLSFAVKGVGKAQNDAVAQKNVKLA